MDNIEDRILNYGLLPAEEQKAVDLYVLEHTEYAVILDELKTLYALIDVTELQNKDRLRETALAYYIAQEHLLSRGMPDEMTQSYNKLKHQIDHDEEVRAQYLAIKSRMEEVANQSDPLAQFEKLSGHRIDTIPMPAEKENAEKENRVKEKAVDWAPVKRKQNILKRRWATYSTMVVLASAVVFSLAMHENRLERMGYLNPVAKYGDATSGLRGGNHMAATEPLTTEQHSLYLEHKLVQERFEEGVDIVLGAQHTTLSLFYSYDLDALSKAEVIFNTILQGNVRDKELTKRVKFALGKVYLAQRRADDARKLLEDVAQSNDVWATEASRLLDKL